MQYFELDLWLATNQSKRSGEYFYILYQPIWLSFFMYISITENYKQWTDSQYIITGMLLSFPLLIIPNIFPSAHDKSLKWTERFVTKSWVYLAILSFIGNYFGTQYFYQYLGASYSFPVTLFLNGTPLFLYGFTQSFFTLYHIILTLLLRRLSHVRYPLFTQSVFILVMSWLLASAEALAVKNVPYYSFTDPSFVYKIGNTLYMLFFVPSFPLYYLIDENLPYSLWESVKSSLSANMIILVLYDFWTKIMGHYDLLPFL